MGTDSNNTGQEFWKTITNPKASKKPKTSIRISFPAGEGFKLLNMAEISSEAGATIVIKLPFPMGEQSLGKMAEGIRQAGGEVEIINGQINPIM